LWPRTPTRLEVDPSRCTWSGRSPLLCGAGPPAGPLVAIRSERTRSWTGPELDARAGDAVLAGLLDAADGYPADARDSLIELGINWSGAPVRLRALQLLAAHEGDHAAATLAHSDPNGRIRAWSQRLTRQGDVTAQITGPDALQTRATTPQVVEQPSLFG
jgi:hypothetical protein